MKFFNILGAMIALAAISMFAAPVMAQGQSCAGNGNGNPPHCQPGGGADFDAEIDFAAGLVGFVAVAGGDFSGTFSTTFAEGFQSGGGQSFGITETQAGAWADHQIGLSSGVDFNAGGFTGSTSQSGSLVNGNGSAWNSTGGGSASFSGAGVGGGIGVAGGAGVGF